MTVRGTSYAHHGAELAQAVYRPFDHRCLQHFGFTVDDVLRVGHAADQLATDRTNALLHKAVGSANQSMETLGTKQAGHDQAGALEDVAQHAAQVFSDTIKAGLMHCSTFVPDDLVGPELPLERVEAVLRELSLSAGALDAREYSGVYDKSPLASHPFFKAGERFLLVIPGASVSRPRVARRARQALEAAPR